MIVKGTETKSPKRLPKFFFMKFALPTLPSDAEHTQRIVYITSIDNNTIITYSNGAEISLNGPVFKIRLKVLTVYTTPKTKKQKIQLERRYCVSFPLSYALCWPKLCDEFFCTLMTAMNDDSLCCGSPYIKNERIRDRINYYSPINHFSKLYNNPNFFETTKAIANKFPQYSYNNISEEIRPQAKKLRRMTKSILAKIFPIWLHLMKPHLHKPRFANHMLTFKTSAHKPKIIIF